MNWQQLNFSNCSSAFITLFKKRSSVQIKSHTKSCTSYSKVHLCAEKSFCIYDTIKLYDDDDDDDDDDDVAQSLHAIVECSVRSAG